MKPNKFNEDGSWIRPSDPSEPPVNFSEVDSNSNFVKGFVLLYIVMPIALYIIYRLFISMGVTLEAFLVIAGSIFYIRNIFFDR